MLTRLIGVIIYIMYTNIESLCCTPEATIMLHVNYSPVFKKSVHRKFKEKSIGITRQRKYDLAFIFP